MRTLFPAGVVAVTATSKMLHGILYPEEAASIKRAVPKRWREFTAGRLCAREALRRLGIERHPILVGEHREPLWPSGVVGTLSHCDDCYGAAVAFRGGILGLGLDIELTEELDSNMIDLICTPPEKEWLASSIGCNSCYWPKVIFSAKESVYKCYFPLLGRFLDFADVEIRIDTSSGNFSAALLVPCPQFVGLGMFRGRFVVNDRYIFTTATLTIDNSSNVA